MSAEVVRLLEEGRYDRARDALQRMLRSDPRNPYLLDTLAVVHAFLGELDRSLFFSEAALSVMPESGPLRVTYANTLTKKGQIDKAREQYLKAIQSADATANAWSGLSALLSQTYDFQEALGIAQEGMDKFGPTGPLIEAYFSALNLCGQAGTTLKDMERLREFARAPMPRILAATAGNYADDVSIARVQDLHREAGEAIIKSFAERRHDWKVSRDPARTMRVGVISSDLRQHPVAAFIRALFAGHDESKMQLSVFSTGVGDDAVTKELRLLVRDWVVCKGMSEENIRDQIIAKQIDVLVELNGLTNGNRLGVCAMRAAPVQVTYCGYPNTTGLVTMDARLVDGLTDPVESEIWHSEQLLRMEGCFLCYAPPADRPAAGCERDGKPVTFGSFHALAKVSDRSLRLWSSVMAEVHGSRMLIKAPGLKSVREQERLIQRCVSAGMDVGRVEVRGPLNGVREHLGAYHDVDIALDAIPYNGTTTTCEALVMGVPVVTLAGDRHASRVGVSLLHAAGFANWIAQNEVAFVQIAKDLAADPGLRVGRETRAVQLMNSALCDVSGWNDRFEQAIRKAWTAWCMDAKGKR